MRKAEHDMNYSKCEAADLLRAVAETEKAWAWNDRLSFLVGGVLSSYADGAEELSDDDLELLSAGSAIDPAHDPFHPQK